MKINNKQIEKNPKDITKEISSKLEISECKDTGKRDGRGRQVNLSIINTKIGRLLVTSYAYSMGGFTYWNCLCDCGNEKIIKRTDLFSRTKTKSCGCIKYAEGCSE